MLIMTDSLFWTGTAEMMSNKYFRKEKTVGYYEKPEELHDFICLGSGRYGYTDHNGRKQTKKRGLNASSMHSPDGLVINNFDWLSALKLANESNTGKMTISVRVLISVGLVLSRLDYTYKDLGRVIEEIREVDLVVGKNKREYSPAIKDVKRLTTQLVDTEPIYLYFGKLGRPTVLDQTLSNLRHKLMDMHILDREKVNKEQNAKRVRKHYKNNGLKELHKERYNFLKSIGLDSKTCQKYCKKSPSIIRYTFQHQIARL